MATCAETQTTPRATSVFGRSDKANIPVRIRPNTHALLQRLCLAEDRSIAGMVDRALKEYVANHKAELEQFERMDQEEQLAPVK